MRESVIAILSLLLVLFVLWQIVKNKRVYFDRKIMTVQESLKLYI
ncbi:hypothetical protein [Halarsenatibacter silvermanii]|uniref:Uncharacterized protein n=1 Tax=Halarsenatibacter silvermanii TaxID=321763 RepID=A0A1G9KUR2_9FIRM|nr:hypothetical protein [Halarsenatibacter silvermanii]SDL53045.1 hypothetical protein SAMN04488692_105100 [Halarsenatibacter silvermanii]